MKKMFGPTGAEIRGQLDVLFGLALASEATRKPDNTLDCEWEGETKVDWDSQTAKVILSGPYQGQRQFEDTDGNIWPESLISLEGEPLNTVPRKEKKK